VTRAVAAHDPRTIRRGRAAPDADLRPGRRAFRSFSSFASRCAARASIEGRSLGIRAEKDSARPALDPIALKHNQRLDYARVAEVLADRGLVEPHAVREALQFSGQGNLPFPEALVTANLVADWELSRVVCEIYNLPFLTVELMEPDPRAMKDLDPTFLVENCLVPLGRFGQVLTVCMPAIVPAEVLGLLASQTDLYILPVVGTVRTNRKWLEMHIKVEPVAPIPAPPSGEQREGGGEWGSIFDAGDAAVLLELQQPGPDSKDVG